MTPSMWFMNEQKCTEGSSKFRMFVHQRTLSKSARRGQTTEGETVLSKHVFVIRIMSRIHQGIPHANSKANSPITKEQKT